MPRVLLASPDAALRQSAQELFESRGYTVSHAASATDVRRHLDHTPPDLVVLDPQIRAVFGPTPVVLLTDQIRAMFGTRIEA